MQHAQPGSISHGTMRIEDLLPTFTSELRQHVERNRAELEPEQVQRAVALIEEADKVTDYDSEAAFELTWELAEELDTFAPPGCYFGANEGDGADYGFWGWDPAETELLGYDVTAEELLDALKALVNWAEFMGGFEAPAWDEAKNLVERARAPHA